MVPAETPSIYAKPGEFSRKGMAASPNFFT